MCQAPFLFLYGMKFLLRNTSIMDDQLEIQEKQQQIKPTCGIIMPISGMPNYPEDHWLDVRSILDDAITTAGFIPNLVSSANEVAVIQRTIVQISLATILLFVM